MSERKSIYRAMRESIKEKVRSRERGDNLNLDQVVRKIRVAKKLTGAEVCRRSGGDLDARTLTALERGRIKNPTVKTLNSIARGLGITISDLFRPDELNQEQNYCVGSPKGAFTMDFAKKGVKIVSFTPLIHDFFCGKLILASKAKVTDQLLDHPFPIFISVLLGSLEVTLEGSSKAVLKEGDNLFFRGLVKHSFQNMLHRETSVLFLTAPSFLR